MERMWAGAAGDLAGSSGWLQVRGGGGSLDEKDAEVWLGLHMSWGRGSSVLGESITLLHHLWVNTETRAHFAPRELIKPKKGLLYSKVVTIRAQSPWKHPGMFQVHKTPGEVSGGRLV